MWVLVLPALDIQVILPVVEIQLIKIPLDNLLHFLHFYHLHSFESNPCIQQWLFGLQGNA